MRYLTAHNSPAAHAAYAKWSSTSTAPREMLAFYDGFYAAEKSALETRSKMILSLRGITEKFWEFSRGADIALSTEEFQAVREARALLESLGVQS